MKKKKEQTGGKRDAKVAFIEKAAADLFSRKSYLETSLKDIAGATKLSKGCIFYYFSTKDEVLFSVLNRFMSEGIEEMTERLAEIKDCRLKILSLIQHTINHYTEKPAEAKTLFRDSTLLSAEHLATIKEKERSYVRMTENVLKELLGEAFPPDRLTAAALLLLGMCGWAFSWYNPRGSITPGELSEMIFSIFVSGIEGYSQKIR